MLPWTSGSLFSFQSPSKTIPSAGSWRRDESSDHSADTHVSGRDGAGSQGWSWWASLSLLSGWDVGRRSKSRSSPGGTQTRGASGRAEAVVVTPVPSPHPYSGQVDPGFRGLYVPSLSPPRRPTSLFRLLRSTFPDLYLPLPLPRSLLFPDTPTESRR